METDGFMGFRPKHRAGGCAGSSGRIHGCANSAAHADRTGCSGRIRPADAAADNSGTVAAVATDDAAGAPTGSTGNARHASDARCAGLVDATHTDCAGFAGAADEAGYAGFADTTDEAGYAEFADATGTANATGKCISVG